MTTRDTTDSLRELVDRVLNLFEPPERISCSTWAEKYRRLSPEASSKAGGAFSFEDAPWQREVLDAGSDPTVGEVVLKWASQVTGKTETLNNIIGYTIDIDPCPMLVIQPQLDMGETWSKDRLSPMLRDTGRLRNKVKDARTRDSGNTLLHKRFPGGHITIAGANSPASLASRPIRKVICDETDRYPVSAGTEGDPMALAEKRTESYPDAIIYKVSSPGIEGLSNIDAAYNASDKRLWFCPCPVCGEHQSLRWDQVDWSEKGTEEAPVYICEYKGCVWDDAMRQKAIRAGEWRATAPFKGVRGYHLNGIYCLFRPKRRFKTRLQQMVADYKKAKAGGEQKEKVWWNTFLAETWKIRGQEVRSESLIKRARTWNGILHPRCLVVVGAADVQTDRIEAEFQGYGDGNESWGLGYHVLMGETDKDEVWKSLDALLDRTWEHPSGQKLRCVMFFIDMGHRPAQVVKFTRARESRGVHACAGSKTAWAALCSRPKRTTARKAVKFEIGGDTAKETIYSRLRVEEEGPRYCHFPVGYGYDEEFFRQLTAERLVTEFDEFGMIKKKHFVKQRERNEALDIRCYGLGALEYLNPYWPTLVKNLAVKTAEQQDGTERTEEKKPAAPVLPVRPGAPRGIRRPGGWANRWR
jgi:phage terminase large subunit GpA-like protein